MALDINQMKKSDVGYCVLSGDDIRAANFDNNVLVPCNQMTVAALVTAYNNPDTRFYKIVEPTEE